MYWNFYFPLKYYLNTSFIFFPIKSYFLTIEWVSEWLLFKTNFSAIQWREQDNFQWDDDDDVQFVLNQHTYLEFYSASSLKQQSVDKHVIPLWHIIFRANQSLFFLLNATCLVEKQQ